MLWGSQSGALARVVDLSTGESYEHASLDDGRWVLAVDALLRIGRNFVRAIDPRTGQELWHMEGPMVGLRTNVFAPYIYSRNIGILNPRTAEVVLPIQSGRVVAMNDRFAVFERREAIDVYQLPDRPLPQPDL